MHNHPVRFLAAALAVALVFAATAALAQDARPSGSGDPASGRALLQQRQVSGCILCHVVPGIAVGGALGPPLVGLAQRYGPEALRLRIADARRFNPQTIMPPALSTEGLVNVARAQQGATVLTEAAVADIVAYLLSAEGLTDAPR